MQIHQSFIFAAGRGERMRPITDSIPKPLVKIKNKAIIDYIIEKLNKIDDIQKIVVNGFYLADEIEKHLKKLHNKKIIFSREVSKIETGGGLLYAMKNNKFDKNQPILLLNGDILWQDFGTVCDIAELCKAYSTNDCNILLGLKKTGEILGYEGKGDFNFNQKNGELSKITNEHNKALSHVFVGLQVVNPKILDDVKEECFSMSYFYKKALGDDGKLNKIKGFELKGKYFHIGEVKTIDLVEKVLS